MRCTISDDRSVVRASVSPRRSLWITLITPFCVRMTALRLTAATASLHHALWLIFLGLLLGFLYLWIFLGNLFESQEVYFKNSSVISSFHLFGLHRVRTYPMKDIQTISYGGYVHRGEPSLRLVLRDRVGPVSVLTGLEKMEAEVLLSTITQSVPVLGSKISVSVQAKRTHETLSMG